MGGGHTIGINKIAGLIAHELQHKYISDMRLENKKGANPKLDNDGDGLLDDWEISSHRVMDTGQANAGNQVDQYQSCHLGIISNPNDADTFGVVTDDHYPELHSYNTDAVEEIRARKAEENIDDIIVPQLDWSKHGIQWSK